MNIHRCGTYTSPVLRSISVRAHTHARTRKTNLLAPSSFPVTFKRQIGTPSLFKISYFSFDLHSALNTHTLIYLGSCLITASEHVEDKLNHAWWWSKFTYRYNCWCCQNVFGKIAALINQAVLKINHRTHTPVSYTHLVQ